MLGAGWPLDTVLLCLYAQMDFEEGSDSLLTFNSFSPIINFMNASFGRACTVSLE